MRIDFVEYFSGCLMRRKHIVSTVLTLLFACGALNVIAQPGLEPSSEFKSMSVEHDVVENGVKGFRVHLNFDVYEANNVDLFARLRFRTVLDGEFLKDSNKKFHDVDGFVAAFAALKPIDNETAYSDLSFFVPSKELDLPADAKYRLDIDADVIFKNGEMLGHLNYFIFDYDSGRTQVASKIPDAKLKSMRVEKDALVGGRRGIRMFVSITIENMKNVPSFLRAGIIDQESQPVSASDKAYADESGNLAVFQNLSATSDSTDVNDIEFFIPYSEPGLGGGKTDVVIDIDVYYEQGGLIKHLELYELSPAVPKLVGP